MKLSLFTFTFAVFSTCFSLAKAENVTWEKQAERLQNVSAALLDNFPVGEPIKSTFGLNLGTVISFLPKTNPTVGAKTEKVPSSPIHAVPTVSLAGLPFLKLGKNWAKFVGLQGWAGFLPPGGEALFGVKAKLTQYSVGFAVQGALPVSKTVFLYVPIGYQHNSVNVEGAITGTNTKDTFKANTNMFFVAPGVKYFPWKMWANVMFVKKVTNSEFTIPADSTNFKIKDDLSDTNLPFATQLSVGADLPYKITTSLSYEIMVQRLAMPKLGLGYQLNF